MLMNLPAASARKQSWYQLETKLHHFQFLPYNRIGAVVSDQFNIHAAHFSVQRRNKVLSFITAKKYNWAIKQKEFGIKSV